MVKVLQNYWSATSEYYDPRLRNRQSGVPAQIVTAKLLIVIVDFQLRCSVNKKS